MNFAMSLIKTRSALGLLSFAAATALAQPGQSQEAQGGNANVGAQAAVYGGIPQSPWFGNTLDFSGDRPSLGQVAA